MKHQLIFIAAWSACSVFAGTLTFTSTPEKTDLIELYTSEGCSSCPPAERRLNDLATREGLWTDFVPIAFHVDYWNYLGWTDRFSSSAFTIRQRTYSKSWHAKTIYTPCFVVNGKATRCPTVPGCSNRPGILTASIIDGLIYVVFIPEKTITHPLNVWVSPLSGEAQTTVTSGENRGRQLKHCFVSLGLERKKMSQEGAHYTAKVMRPIQPGTEGIAIWVTTTQSQDPIQATGGWLK